jgi:hypothetical protein
MRCTKCWAPVAICACALVAAVSGKIEAVECGEFPRPASIIRLSLCSLPPVDMADEEPGQMPGRPLPNVTWSVLTSSSTSVHSGTFTLPL